MVSYKNAASGSDKINSEIYLRYIFHNSHHINDREKFQNFVIYIASIEFLQKYLYTIIVYAHDSFQYFFQYPFLICRQFCEIKHNKRENIIICNRYEKFPSMQFSK